LFSLRVEEICEIRSQWAEAEQEKKSKGGQIKNKYFKKIKILNILLKKILRKIFL